MSVFFSNVAIDSTWGAGLLSAEMGGSDEGSFIPIPSGFAGGSNVGLGSPLVAAPSFGEESFCGSGGTGRGALGVSPLSGAACAGSGVTKVEWAIADVSKSSSIKEADLNWQTFPNDSEATFDVDMTKTDTVTSGTQTTTKTINAKYKCYVRMYYTNRVVTTQGTTKTVSYQDQVTKTVIGDEVVLGNSYMPTPVVTNITANSITVSPVNPINISTGTYTDLRTEYAVSTSPSAPANGSNNWTTATTIGGLSANTKYYVFARSTGIAPNTTARTLVPDSVSAAVGPYVTLTAVNLQAAGSVSRSPYTKDLDIFGTTPVDVWQAEDGSTMVWLSGAINTLSNTA